MRIIKIFTWFRIMVRIITYAIYITNFIKVKNDFNYFGIYFHLSVHNCKGIFHINIFQSTMMYVGKK